MASSSITYPALDNLYALLNGDVKKFILGQWWIHQLQREFACMGAPPYTPQQLMYRGIPIELYEDDPHHIDFE